MGEGDFKEKINQDDYMKALGLFMLANEHYRKACEFEYALNRIIMVKPQQFPGGHVGDAIYTLERQTTIDFSEALAKEGVVVELENTSD